MTQEKRISNANSERDKRRADPGQRGEHPTGEPGQEPAHDGEQDEDQQRQPRPAPELERIGDQPGNRTWTARWTVIHQVLA